jgi:hypothetical protein
VAALVTLQLPVAGSILPPSYSFAIDCAATVLWIVSSFLLRYEIQVNFAWPDGSLPEVSIVWTLLFSVFYLNYCVSSRSDLP